MTALPDKATRYGAEVWFREAWQDFADEAGDQSLALAQELAAVLFKPDGIACQVIDQALEYLSARGFVPLVAQPIRLNRHMTRWLWLYRFNVASIERVHLHDLVNETGESVLVVLRDRQATDGPIPGTVRLTAVKGSSRPERRTGDQLRTYLRNDDRILNFLHTSDEPADLVRELGILLDRHERRKLLRSIVANDPFVLPRLAVAVEEPRTLDLGSTLARLQEAFGRAESPDASDHERLAVAEAARAAATKEGGALRRLWELVSMREDVDRWDLAVVGVHAIEYDEPGIESQTLGDAPLELWERRVAGAGAIK